MSPTLNIKLKRINIVEYCQVYMFISSYENIKKRLQIAVFVTLARFNLIDRFKTEERKGGFALVH